MKIDKLSSDARLGRQFFAVFAATTALGGVAFLLLSNKPPDERKSNATSAHSPTLFKVEEKTAVVDRQDSYSPKPSDTGNQASYQVANVTGQVQSSAFPISTPQTGGSGENTSQLRTEVNQISSESTGTRMPVDEARGDMQATGLKSTTQTWDAVSSNPAADGNGSNSAPARYRDQSRLGKRGFTVEQEWYRSWYGWGAFSATQPISNTQSP